MKKRVFMALLAAVSSFAMVSCGDDDKDDDPTPSNSVSTKAEYKETDNSVSVTFPVTETNTTESTTIEYKFSNGYVTEHTATIVCTSTEAATVSYQIYMQGEGEDIDENESIEKVEQKGNTIVVYYTVEEGMTKEEAITTIKLVAYANGVEGISLDEIVPTNVNDIE